MRIDVLTLFPDAIAHYVTTSVLGRAGERGVFELHLHDFRDATTDPHRSVDDTPFGGGAGMVLRAEPIIATVESIPELAKPVIALTPSGRVFTHDVAVELSALSGFTLLSGRYEGIRSARARSGGGRRDLPRRLRVGRGELAALCVIESVVRLLPGGLGNDASSAEESFSDGLLEYPQYTKPADVRGRGVPEILLSGNHERIARWRRAQALP
jgi:tRNA (guanine37-N1)-methyltransferase